MKKNTHKVLIGVQTLVLTLMTALPAQAAINIGGPMDTSGSVVTLHPSTNSSGALTYSVVYPVTSGNTGSTGTTVTTTSPVSAPAGNSTVSWNSGTSASGTTPAAGTSVVSLSSLPYYGTGAVLPVTTPVYSGGAPSQISVGQAYTGGGSSEVSLGSLLSSSSAPVTSTQTTPVTPPSTVTPPSNQNPAPITIAPATSLTPDEQAIVDMVNQERTAAGLKPLQVDLRLEGVAQTKAQDMQTNQYFSHTSPTYGSPWAMMQLAGLSVGWAGENIAGNDSAAAAMAAWMASPGHRANILDPNFTDIGVGVANGSPYNIYVQEFLQE